MRPSFWETNRGYCSSTCWCLSGFYLQWINEMNLRSSIWEPSHLSTPKAGHVICYFGWNRGIANHATSDQFTLMPLHWSKVVVTRKYMGHCGSHLLSLSIGVPKLILWAVFTIERDFVTSVSKNSRFSPSSERKEVHKIKRQTCS